MSRYCTCAGNFAYTVSIDDFCDKLKTFRNVARYAQNNILTFSRHEWVGKAVNAGRFLVVM